MLQFFDAGLEGAFRPPAPAPQQGRPGLFQLLAMLKRNPLECWSQEFFEEPIASFKLPLIQAVLVHDPPAIKRVLVENAGNYRKDPIQRRILATGLGDGLLSVEGERWERQRRSIAPLFARRPVASFIHAMREAADHLGERWRTVASDQVIDVAAEMRRLTLDVLARTIFSDGIAGDYDEFGSAMNAYFNAIGQIDLFDLLRLPRILPRPGRKSLRASMIYF
jgi:cytochrome P450